MKSQFFALASLCLMSMNAYGDTWRPEDTASRLPQKICYGLQVEVEDLLGGPDSVASSVSIPLCMGFAENAFDVEQGQRECTLGPTSSYHCWYQIKPGYRVVTLTTPKFQFPATIKTEDQHTGFFSGGPNLSLSSEYLIETNWDYRINQILAAHKEDLDNRIVSVILPPARFNSYPGMRWATFGTWTSHDAFYELDPTSNASLEQMDGIGLDESGKEYAIKITLNPTNVVFPQ